LSQAPAMDLRVIALAVAVGVPLEVRLKVPFI